jgi:hypothetical protein
MELGGYMISKNKQESKIPKCDIASSAEIRRRLGNMYYAIKFNLIPADKERLTTLFKYQAQSNKL